MNGTAPETPPTLVPDRRTRNLITFLLRLGIGFPLLNAGLLGFWSAQAMVRQASRVSYVPGPPGSLIPGAEGVYQFLPYLQIVASLAILLGFFTTLATAAAVALSFLPGLVQTIASITACGPGAWFSPYGNPFVSWAESAALSGQSTGLLLAAALIWLASIGWNGWSLDGLVFEPMRLRRSGVAAGPAKPASPDVPVSGAVGG